MRLAAKITLLFLVPFLALLVLFGYRSAQREIAAYDSQIATDLKAIGRVTHTTFVELSRVEGEARAVEILSATGDEALHVRWVPDPSPPPPEVLRDEDANTVSVRIPVREAWTSGSILLSRPLDETELVRAATRDQLAATAIALAIAVLLASLVGLGFIGRPVRALVSQTRRVARGDLSQRLKLSRRDEIGQLAREIDLMCDDLSPARDQTAAESEARIAAVEQLRHADRLATVGKLASGVAHELGTPLTVIAGRARNLISRKVEQAELVENATVIVEQAERMTRIIKQLLDFSRRRVIEKQSVDPSELVAHCARVLEPLAKKRGVSIALDCKERSPIAADPMLLEQVLVNLIVNAIDAMPNGGVVRVLGHRT